MAPENAPLLGTLLHGIGAASAALCYAPQRYVKHWSWQSYWLLQALGCWLILPVIFAFLTVPDLHAVLAEAPAHAMFKSYYLGALYGVGGIAFGVAIRYVGYSLTYAIAIGVSCVLGTLLPPLQDGTLMKTLGSTDGIFVVSGVLLGGFAMLTTGFAGFRKERELAEAGTTSKFNAGIGIPICLLAGCLSAVFSFSIGAGAPIAAIAAQHGAGIFQENVIYIFSNSGAFTTTLIYAGWLATRGKTWGEFFKTSDGTGLARNYALSLLTGLLWYLQFFFFGLGHVHMGKFQFSSWAIHMIILIFLSCGFGVAIGEWKACRPKTRMLVVYSLLLLLGAVGMITYGNYRASPPQTASAH